MTLSPGTRIGTYEVVGLIGTGGMGEVYRALDTTLNREAALKVLPDSLAGEIARRFPQFLADGRHFIFQVQTTERSDWFIAVGSIDSTETGKVVQASYADSRRRTPSCTGGKTRCWRTPSTRAPRVWARGCSTS